MVERGTGGAQRAPQRWMQRPGTAVRTDPTGGAAHAATATRSTTALWPPVRGA